MKKYIREVTESIIERMSSSLHSNKNQVCGEQFLLEEGLDLLASLKTIQDKETRLLLKRLIDAVAECHGNVPPRLS